MFARGRTFRMCIAEACKRLLKERQNRLHRKPLDRDSRKERTKKAREELMQTVLLLRERNTGNRESDVLTPHLGSIYI